MDITERIAKIYLLNNFQSVVYEPDGNIPPDFLVDGRIAVEVRRLNQNSTTSDKHRGLEEDSIPLAGKMTRFLESLGPPKQEISYWVSFRFRRPFPKWRVLKHQISEALMTINDETIDGEIFFKIEQNFRIVIRRTTSDHPYRFTLASYTDSDAGGWVFEQMKINLELCIDEKSEKVAPYKSKYSEWWLIFVDFIGYGLNDLDQQLFKENIKIDHTWDRVILIDPRNPHRTMVL